MLRVAVFSLSSFIYNAYDFMRFESNSTLKMYENEPIPQAGKSCLRQTSHDAEGQFMTPGGQIMTERDKCYRH
jgi:hypothetical protein